MGDTPLSVLATRTPVALKRKWDKKWMEKVLLEGGGRGEEKESDASWQKS